MTKRKYLEDISQIKNMMEQSSRFISLSGLSGVMAGLYALAGAYLASTIIPVFPSYRLVVLTQEKIMLLIVIGLAVLFLSLGTGIYLTIRRSRKLKLKSWDHTTRRMLVNLAIPLATGGVFVLILISKGMLALAAPASLIFYGLSLVNASKYTYGDIRALGIIEISLGLTATFFVGFGLVFWAIGFGVMHIIYGILMYIKYERETADTNTPIK
jgi:hypothetical protein